MASRSGSRIPLAVVFLLLILASLIALLVACPPSQPKSTQPSAPTTVEEKTAPEPVPQQPADRNIPPERARQERAISKGLISILIDDAGYSLEDLQPYLELPGPIAIAVLPHLPHSKEAARRVREAGKELLLHCPMEPLGSEDPGPGALRTTQSAEEIERLLISAFDSVPGAIGLNNHMGSKATADERLMSVVLSFLAKEGKLFLDSRTTPETVAARLAARFSIPYLERDVFLDAGGTRAEIERSFASGVSVARTRGSAVMISHVQSQGVLDMLQRRALDAEPGGLAETGIRLARLSELLQ